MSQEEISEILKNNYPNWMSYEDIMRHTNLSKQSIYKSLKFMRKRNEIELKIVQGNKIGSNWKNMYRIKTEV